MAFWYLDRLGQGMRANVYLTTKEANIQRQIGEFRWKLNVFVVKLCPAKTISTPFQTTMTAGTAG